jgi:hypothetical protein
LNPGSVFFDVSFSFSDGDAGRKLFIVLGSLNAVYVVAKTTSNDKYYSAEQGCQPDDRFHNFHIPEKTCDLDGRTWVCLHELYELKQNETLQKSFGGQIKAICDLTPELTRELQDCALFSDDTTKFQQSAIEACLAD